MKVSGALAVSILFLAGCAQPNPYAVMRDANRAALVSVDVGMSKAQVQDIMGTKSAEIKEIGLGRFENPYKRETIQGKDGQSYEILYYYTQQIGDNPIETGLSPVVFLGGKVVGIGWGFLDGLTGTSTSTIRRR